MEETVSGWNVGGRTKGEKRKKDERAAPSYCKIAVPRFSSAAVELGEAFAA